MGEKVELRDDARVLLFSTSFRSTSDNRNFVRECASDDTEKSAFNSIDPFVHLFTLESDKIVAIRAK